MKKLILLLLVFGLFYVEAAQSQSIPAQAAEIDALAEAIEAYTKRPKTAKIVLADVSDYESAARPRWQRFATEKALERHRDKSEAYTIAYVWLNGGKVVSTNFTLFSPSGDWVKYVYSYFRPDGTLARVETDFRTFNGDFKVIRRRYFESAGKEIKSSVKILDLQTGKPKKAPDGVMGDDTSEVDYYLTAEKLPFASLLTKK